MCALQPPWLDQCQKGGMVGLVRTICSAALDLQGLRSHYSFDLLGLLASLMTKAATARPSLKALLATPFMQVFKESIDPRKPSASPRGGSPPQASMATVARASPPPPPPVAPSAREIPSTPPGEEWSARGTDAHAAAAVLQRSFHGGVARGRFNPRSVRLGDRAVQVAPPTGLAAAMHQAQARRQ